MWIYWSNKINLKLGPHKGIVTILLIIKSHPLYGLGTEIFINTNSNLLKDDLGTTRRLRKWIGYTLGVFLGWYIL